MIAGEELVGKALALILWSEDEKGEDTATVLAGTVKVSDSGYVWFGKREQTIEFGPDWLDRIRPVTPTFKDTLLGADHMISLWVENLPDDADVSQ